MSDLNNNIVNINNKETTAGGTRSPKTGGSAGVSLGNTTVNVSPLGKNNKKWSLQERVKNMTQGKNFRVSDCMKPIGKVSFQRSGNTSKVDGVMLCGSVWLCPVCSQRIAYERQKLIDETLNAGFDVLLVTATLQHNRDDELSDLLDALKEALRKLKMGKWWKNFREKYGVEAYLSSYEITYGNNGWHPHSHILIYVSKKVDVAEFWSRLTGKYIKAIEKTGRYASEYHGLDVRETDKGVSSYMTKWSLGSELTGNFNKNSLSIWDLVEQGRGDLVLEYAAATFGLKSLTWSHHAKDILGVSNFEVEKSDEWETVAYVSDKVWKTICKHSLQGFCLSLAVLDDGGEALKKYIGQLCSESNKKA